MSKRYIDADAFLWELTHWKGTDGNYHENSQTFYTLDEVMDAVEEADVEAEPVKHGHWAKITEDFDVDEPLVGRCSACGWFAGMYEGDVVGMNYCPNCGARMDGESK